MSIRPGRITSYNVCYTKLLRLEVIEDGIAVGDLLRRKRVLQDQVAAQVEEIDVEISQGCFHGAGDC